MNTRTDTRTDTRAAGNDPAHLDRLARRRAHAKLGWYAHAAVYACVNLALVLLSASQGRHWGVFPLLGWGLGLGLHGLRVWLLAPGGDLMNRLVARERAQLERHPGR